MLCASCLHEHDAMMQRRSLLGVICETGEEYSDGFGGGDVVSCWGARRAGGGRAYELGATSGPLQDALLRKHQLAVERVRRHEDETALAKRTQEYWRAEARRYWAKHRGNKVEVLKHLRLEYKRRVLFDREARDELAALEAEIALIAAEEEAAAAKAKGENSARGTQTSRSPSPRDPRDFNGNGNSASFAVGGQQDKGILSNNRIVANVGLPGIGLGLGVGALAGGAALVGAAGAASAATRRVVGRREIENENRQGGREGGRQRGDSSPRGHGGGGMYPKVNSSTPSPRGRGGVGGMYPNVNSSTPSPRGRGGVGSGDEAARAREAPRPRSASGGRITSPPPRRGSGNGSLTERPGSARVWGAHSFSRANSMLSRGSGSSRGASRSPSPSPPANRATRDGSESPSRPARPAGDVGDAVSEFSQGPAARLRGGLQQPAFSNRGGQALSASIVLGKYEEDDPSAAHHPLGVPYG